MLRPWRELRDARRKGRRDGRAGVPNVDQDALPFSLREILARAEERVSRLVQRWTQDVHALETELADLTDHSASAEARLADAEMQHQEAHAEQERRKRDEDAHLAALQGQLEELPTAEPVSLDLDEQLARIRRAQRLEDEARKRTEDAYRRRLDGERQRRQQELELRTRRRQAEIEVRKSEVLARREEIAESMRPIREAARERAERIAELGELVHQARAMARRGAPAAAR